MEAVAHSPAFAKKVGIKQSVGKDFAAADKSKSFKQGGINMKRKQINPALALMAARALGAPTAPAPAAPMAAPVGMPAPGMKKGGDTSKLFKGKESYSEELKEAKAVKSGKITPEEYASGEEKETKKMAKGGETMGPRSMSKDVEAGSNKLTKFGESAIQKRGKTRGQNLGDSGPTRMATGGSASSRGDGCAERGKTKGKYL